ncbi:FMN-dependent L-lactate dehydrogenase LldD [Legionella micdadei]|uniref:L-lactate dehydrogenase (Cytochrome) n=1 Tax=Legionella micdadei TaxID=451 RepID=A0A098GJT9_LEGMI|nr:FMN-dependent L-lactate dehydrogenase LldD [Legionella micdadei]ARG98662.1 alpha-hydroxy-acid oxidizing enzyme [Legionella micdadei]ARH01375.1 alpha-hydroxy-acid oxidizing enzyme [Legionella micdadei]KTD28870.1 FMN-dependent dehydrogenase [Legionella micdadei]NSL17082.1 FMN-dependent L-lactate dehydrogenase LldD [Legionella micdadei]CEG62250.1 L-lactate dehydrogenase [cytochrome] [Legionella micdadei]
MIISSPLDYREAAKRKLPRFLFDYIDGGSYSECTLRANLADLEKITLRQRVLKKIDHLNLETELFGQKLAMPIALAPVGITGMYARRGEVQAAKAAAKYGIPFTLSTLSICPLEEVAAQSPQPIWFQLYVLKDRGFLKNMLERAQAAGIKTLVFTADMPVPGARYRDAHSGMTGRFSGARRLLQTITKPSWAFDVGIMGRPHALGNVSKYLGKPMGLANYIDWLTKNFDPTISWKDLEWIRDFWQGPMIIKGILDPQDAKDAIQFGASGIVVSNHGGRQLDGVMSTAKALPLIADAVGDTLPILIDSGIRSGLDVVRMLALGAKIVLIGRAAAYALATAGQAGIENLLDIFAKEMHITMTLAGVSSVAQINKSILI